MKKLLATITVIAFAVAANAKTSAELSAEYIAAINAGNSEWDAAVKVYQDNAADVAALFEAWKNTTSAKFSENEAPNKSATDAQKLENSRMRRLYTQYLLAHSDKFAGTPKRTALLTCPSRCVDAFGVDNPNFYEELKAAGFVVDGAKLPAYAICNLAQAAQDYDYIKALPVADGLLASDIYLKYVFDGLLESTDAVAAKAKCREIVNALASRKMFSSPYFAQAQEIDKILTRRLIDSKISK